MAVWLLIMLALPLVAAVVSAVIGDEPVCGWLSSVAATGAFAAALVAVFAYHVVRGRHALGSVFFLDGLSGVFLIAVAFVYAVVAVYSAGYLLPHIGHVRLRRWYWPLLNLFGLALLATPMVANLGVLWVAVELTTVVSALLVTSEGSDQSLEAGWKYIVIGSAGLAVGLLGIVLIYAAGVPTLGDHYTPTYTTLAHAGAAPERVAGPCRVRVRAGRVRHQGRTGADARLAARRPLRGAEPDQRDAVGRAAGRGPVRGATDRRDRAARGRPDLRPRAAAGVRRAVAAAGRRCSRCARPTTSGCSRTPRSSTWGSSRSGSGSAGRSPPTGRSSTCSCTRPARRSRSSAPAVC